MAIEVDDIKKAVAFYQDVFNLEKLDSGEGDAFFKLGEHQFLAIFEVEKVQPANMRHFGIMVRDEQQLTEVRKKITGKYKLKLEPPFRCDFCDPWGNRIEVVEYRDIQFTKAPHVLRGMGIRLEKSDKAKRELAEKGMAPD